MKNMGLFFTSMTRLTMVILVIHGGLSLTAQNQNCLAFDGTDDNVVVSNGSSLVMGATAMSLTCWVYPGNTNITFPDYDGFCGIRNNADADFYLIQHGPLAVEARFRNASGTNFDVVMTGLQINDWQHFAFVYTGSELKLYHNAVEVGSTPASGAIMNTTVPIHIGNLEYITNNFYLNGKLDEFSLWGKALGPDEVQQIYQCAINPATPGLLLYYTFDQGIAGGNNTGITTLLPDAGTLTGTLNNFALNGNNSNWVEGVATPVYAYTVTICDGETYQFGSQTLTGPGVYTETFPTTSGCDSVVELTLNVLTVNTGLTLMGITLTAQQGGAGYQWLDCSNNFAQVPNATGQSFTPTANGSYAVAVTWQGCTDTSSCVAVSTVGLADESPLGRLRVYPNPVSNLLQVDAGRELPEVILSLQTICGKEVKNLRAERKQLLSLDLSELDDGVYLLYLWSGNAMSCRKVVK